MENVYCTGNNCLVVDKAKFCGYGPKGFCQAQVQVKVRWVRLTNVKYLNT